MKVCDDDVVMLQLAFEKNMNYFFSWNTWKKCHLNNAHKNTFPMIKQDRTIINFTDSRKLILVETLYSFKMGEKLQC